MMSQPRVHFVTYAKVTEDRKAGLDLDGVYLGGFTFDSAEADRVAVACVNTVRGGTILPKVYSVPYGTDSRSVLERAEDHFIGVVDTMRDTERVFSRRRRS